MCIASLFSPFSIDLGAVRTMVTSLVLTNPVLWTKAICLPLVELSLTYVGDLVG